MLPAASQSAPVGVLACAWRALAHTRALILMRVRRSTSVRENVCVSRAYTPRPWPRRRRDDHLFVGARRIALPPTAGQSFGCTATTAPIAKCCHHRQRNGAPFYLRRPNSSSASSLSSSSPPPLPPSERIVTRPSRERSQTVRRFPLPVVGYVRFLAACTCRCVWMTGKARERTSYER